MRSLPIWSWRISVKAQRLGTPFAVIRRVLPSVVLIVAYGLILVAGVYSLPLNIEQDIGVPGRIAMRGLYRAERNEQFSYAYSRGDIDFRLPQIGNGTVAISLRMAGPLGTLPVAARVATQKEQATLGMVSGMRIYRLLVPTTEDGDLHFRVESATTRVEGDWRRLGILLDQVQVRVVSPAWPPALLLVITPIVLLLIWLILAELPVPFGAKVVVFIVAAGLLGCGYAYCRARVTLQSESLLTPAAATLIAVKVRRFIPRFLVMRNGWIQFNPVWTAARGEEARAIRERVARLFAPYRACLRAHPLMAKWKWTAYPLAVFVCTRIGLLSFSYIAMTINPILHEEGRQQHYLPNAIALDSLCRWDCGWFDRIARDGYLEAVYTNFFPLLPLLSRGLHEVTDLDVTVSLIAVANLASLGAFLVIYRIFSMLADEAAAKWGLILLAAYPFAFFQATGYPESLMSFFSALAVLFALQGKHVAAGITLGVGSLARHLTLLAGAALLAAQVHQRGVHPRRLLLNWSILGLLMPWLILSLYLLYQYVEFGDPLAFFHARELWGPIAWWGLHNFLQADAAAKMVPGVPVNDYILMVYHLIYSYLPFAALVTVGGLALTSRKEWIELAAFAIVLLLMLWGAGIWGIGRYSASCWPAFLPLGVWLSARPRLQPLLVGILAMFQGLYFLLFAYGYPVL